MEDIKYPDPQPLSQEINKFNQASKPLTESEVNKDMSGRWSNAEGNQHFAAGFTHLTHIFYQALGKKPKQYWLKPKGLRS